MFRPVLPNGGVCPTPPPPGRQPSMDRLLMLQKWLRRAVDWTHAASLGTSDTSQTFVCLGPSPLPPRGCWAAGGRGLPASVCFGNLPCGRGWSLAEREPSLMLHIIPPSEFVSQIHQERSPPDNGQVDEHRPGGQLPRIAPPRLLFPNPRGERVP